MRILLKSTLVVAATLFATSALAASGKLVLYTSQPDATIAKTVEAFNKVQPDVEVEIFRSGTTDVMSKLLAEFAAGSPKPDALFVADVVNMERLKKDGRLMAHEGADVSGYPANIYDPDMTYFGTKMITTGIVYNTAATQVPTSWADLTGEAYKGQVIMPSPLYSGAAAITLGSVTRYADLGWKFYEDMVANGAIAVRGNGATLKAVAGGERAYGIVVDFMALNAKAKGSPVDFVFPSEGVTAVTEPVAILSTAKNPDAAKAFVDFLLSEDGQKLAASQGFIPAMPGVAGPAWFPEGTQVNLMPMDAAGILTTTDDEKKRFEGMFGG
ncbi:MAG: ABC transporter substrate-binding protein [Alphaproteobacteria bacterium]